MMDALYWLIGGIVIVACIGAYYMPWVDPNTRMLPAYPKEPDRVDAHMACMLMVGDDPSLWQLSEPKPLEWPTIDPTAIPEKS